MSALDRVKAQLVIVTGLLVLYFIFKSVYWLYAAAAVGVLSLMIPAVGNGIVWVWFKIAEVLGTINGKIILTILFWVFLFPIALLYRLTAKNPMSVKRNNGASLYHERNHTYTKEDLEQTW
ncbi:hypothetical protein [Larkinella soli]|uniref:hypothetical protein n=1 Tax=Larkinella soli TaxID=1770527 RepID=UPI000FFCC5DB|nr:hypothetical protein [Larkinella soli]